MSKVINCECGEVVQADSDDELVAKVDGMSARPIPSSSGTGPRRRARDAEEA